MDLDLSSLAPRVGQPTDELDLSILGPTPKDIAAVNATASPDNAAKAINLAPRLGPSPSMAEATLKLSEEQVKQQRAAEVVGNNPHIGAYVGRNVMASKVSNDDYETLDKISTTLS